MTHIRRVPGTTGGAYTLALASDDVGMGGGGGGMLAGDAAGAGPAAFDHLGSPLAVLAAVFSVSPTLWLDPAQRLGSVEPFITRVINSGPMRLSADVRVPFLDMMASLAAVEAGASQVISTLAAMAGKPALEMLSWRKLVAVVVEYCARYAGVMADIARQGSAFVPTRDERLMNEQEAAILVAFLGLVTAVLTHGAPVEVRAFVEGQERDAAPLLGGLPLFEPFLQLMCAPVPNTVKAALDDVLGGFAR